MKRISFLLSILIALHVLTPGAYAYTKDDKILALEQFRDCAFAAEYCNNTRNYTVRWDKPIHVYLGGNYTDADISFFYSFISYLMDNISGIPEICITPAEYLADVRMYFSPLSDMGLYASNYREGNWGFFTFWNDGDQITNAEIAIAADVTTQEVRFHLIAEEFVGVLGLANDHYLNYDSILFADQNETYALTEADRLMLEFLYHPNIPAGLTWSEIEPLLLDMY
ncbi:MAG: DUF2927 domain-containing protein [Clostridia bacterium]|nr:DUF2927 domain-containing protein [Clostridia bacterium]